MKKLTLKQIDNILRIEIENLNRQEIQKGITQKQRDVINGQINILYFLLYRFAEASKSKED